MTGILQVLGGLIAALALLSIAVTVSRRSHAGREPRAAGTAAVPPVRHEAAGGMAVPAIVQPSAIERGPYDDGPLIGGPS